MTDFSVELLLTLSSDDKDSRKIACVYILMAR